MPLPDAGRLGCVCPLMGLCGAPVTSRTLQGAKDFRTDADLAIACEEDATQFCKDVKPGEGRIQDCLVHPWLACVGSGCRCASAVLSICRQAQLAACVACPVLARLCRGGAVQMYGCTRFLHPIMLQPPLADLGSWLQRAKIGQTSWDCQEELFRQNVENADDVRLNYRLLRKCQGDKQKFCKDIRPGGCRCHRPALATQAWAAWAAATLASCLACMAPAAGSDRC